MEIDKLFNGSVDSIPDDLFGSINNSVSEVRELQKKKVAENVQLVIQALKKIESDLREQFGSVSGSLEKRILSIKDGKDGINGRDGKPGRDGKDGKDGKDGRPGRDGLPGRPGADGRDGVGVLGARIDFDGALVITLTNGQEINVGEVVAPELAESIKVITNGGGTSQSVLDTLASLQAQISAIASLGAVSYQGTWNASTNTPTITSGSGTKGYYYVVSVAGTTSIDSEAKWGVGDWIVFNGTSWQKVDGGDTGDFTNLNVSGTTTLSGGTSNGVAYLNGSKVLTSGSALTFDGTLLSQTVADAIISTKFKAATGGIRLKPYDATNGVQWEAVNAAENAYIPHTLFATTINNNFSTAATWGVVGGSEQMRLTSTGLEIKQSQLIGYSSYAGIGTNGLAVAGNVGIGTSSPGAKLEVNAGANTDIRVNTSASGYLQLGQFTNGAFIGTSSSDATAGVLRFGTGGTAQMRLDTAGNLGLGVTPSATQSTYRSFELFGSIWMGGNGTTPATYSLTNAYYDGSFKYKNTGYVATQYAQDAGAHKWYNAPSGTAGNAITFTQAMTLDASGNLGIGTSLSEGNISSFIGKETIKTTGAATNNALTLAWEHLSVTTGIEQRISWAFGDDASSNAYTHSAYIAAGKQGSYQSGSVRTSYLSFATENAGVLGERARIDSSGNLLVGKTAAALGTAGVEAQPVGYLAVTRAERPFVLNRLTTDGDFIELYRDGVSKATLGITSNSLTFGTGGSERARITSGGYSKFSNDGTYVLSTGSYHEFRQTANNLGLYVTGTNASLTTDGIILAEAARNTTNNSFYALSYYNSGAGAYKWRVADSGNVTNTNGSYGTISDAKMKTDIVDAGSQWSDIKAIRFRKFKMKDDPEQRVQLGVVAQELEQTSPGLVEEHADRDAEGNDLGTVTKSVKTSILLMKAAVALQEAMARIEQLETRVAQLEGK